MKERRRAPRVPAKLPIELRLPGQKSAFVGETINLSVNGIYFKSEYFMEEGTKLPILLKLPEEGASGACSIAPEGIVVRCLPEEEEPAAKSYEIACFFMSIEELDSENLKTYLTERLAAQKAG